MDMKIMIMSDTHELHSLIHEFVMTHPVDMVICAGDAANHKIAAINNNKLRDFLHWYGLIDAKYKIFVPGNHDTSLEVGLIKPSEFPNIDFLINDSKVYKKGLFGHRIKIWGSPITPSFGMGWAWNCKRGKINKYWQQMPDDTNIAVTHGPPHGILDLTAVGYGNELQSVGCKNLMTRIRQVEPKYHIFGHVHNEKNAINNGFRKLNDLNTTFINASIADIQYKTTNNPIIIEY